MSNSPLKDNQADGEDEGSDDNSHPGHDGEGNACNDKGEGNQRGAGQTQGVSSSQGGEQLTGGTKCKVSGLPRGGNPTPL